MSSAQRYISPRPLNSQLLIDARSGKINAIKALRQAMTLPRVCDVVNPASGDIVGQEIREVCLISLRDAKELVEAIAEGMQRDQWHRSPEAATLNKIRTLLKEHA